MKTDDMVYFKFEGAIPLKSQQLATWLLCMHDMPPDLTATRDERLWAVFIAVMMQLNQGVGGSFSAGVQSNAKR